MEATQQQISVAEIATAIGTENLVLRLVQLQRQITELEAALAALRAERTEDKPRPAVPWGEEHHEVRSASMQRIDEEQQAARNGR